MRHAACASAIAVLIGALPAARALDSPSPPANRKLIVVLRLTAKDLLSPERSVFLSQRIQSVLRASLREQYSVLSYADEQLQEIAKSNGVDLAQCAEDTCVVIGRKVSADFVVSGEITQLDKELDLTLRVQDVGTRETRRESVQKLAHAATFDDIAAAMDLAAAELTAELKAPGVVVKETTGLLALSIDPPGATVSIDRKPAEVLAGGRLERFLPLGSHSVVVRKPGYQEVSTPAFIEPGKPQSIALTLMRLPPKVETPKTAVLGVDSDPQGAKIFVDGVESDKRTPAFLHELGTGEHEVVVEKDSFVPYRTTVTLQAGDSTSAVMAKLHSNVGTLTVQSDPPGATVFIDDEEQPQPTPFKLDHMIAKAYRVRFSLPKYQPVDKFAVVVPDQQMVVEATLVPRFGSVLIRSDPPGANVYVDGDQRPGETPLTLQDLDLGSHSIRLTKPLYADAQQNTKVESGKQAEVSLVLSAKFGTLRVTAESGGEPLSGAEVLVDGQIVGVTPYVNERAKEGSVSIEVRADLYRSFETIAHVEPGTPAVVRAELAKEFGNLTASTIPAARLLVDGEQLGKADGIPRRLRMGRHEITLEPFDRDHYRPYVSTLVIEPGKEVGISQTLVARKGGAVIVSLPTGATVYRGREHLGLTPLTISNWLVGDYSVRVDKEMYVPAQVAVQIDEGETNPVEVTLKSVDMEQYEARRKIRRIGYASVGVAALLGTAAGILGWQAQVAGADWASARNYQDWSSASNRTNTLSTAATATWIAAGVFAIAGSALALTHWN